MDGVKRYFLVLCVMTIGQVVQAEEPKPTTPPVTTTMPPSASHSVPSVSGNRAPLMVNRDERSARPTDGTFGYDVRRPFFLSQRTYNRITLYTPDRRERGYKTEGIHLFDILSVRPIKKSLHPEKHEEEHGGAHGEAHGEAGAHGGPAEKGGTPEKKH